MKKVIAPQVVVITGGSSGIGKALAREYLAAGDTVVIGARDPERRERARQELEPVAVSGGGCADLRFLDVTDSRGVGGFVEGVLRDHGHIDILVNCAGLAVCKAMEDTLPEEYRQVMEANCTGLVDMTRAVVPSMRLQKKGHIVNVTSMAGVMGIYGYSAYTPSKFAATGFTEVLRSEVWNDGIRVSLVLPPDTDTPQFEAENRTKPAITKDISGSLRPLTAEWVARYIKQKVDRRAWLIIPGSGTRLIFWLNRHFPGLIWMITRGILGKHRSGRSETLPAG